MHDFESASKIKVRSCSTFFKILLMSAVICISKVFHGNKLKLTEPIIEISLKVLLVKLLFVTLKLPMHFVWVVEFLTTFLTFKLI